MKRHIKKRALEPKRLFCKILQKEVTVLIEHLDYKSIYYSDKIGEIYCSNILECYQNNIKCKYSGISKFFPDPFDKNFNDIFYKEFVGEKEFKRIQKLRKQKA
ncbi:MAG: hypothetical protein ABDH21_05640 [bacterium]